jgi:hypothetical protein
MLKIIIIFTIVSTLIGFDETTTQHINDMTRDRFETTKALNDN